MSIFVNKDTRVIVQGITGMVFFPSVDLVTEVYKMKRVPLYLI